MQGEHSKILPNEAFGYRKVTVERPLKVRYEITEAGIEALAAMKPVQAAMAKVNADMDEAFAPLVEQMNQLATVADKFN